MASIKLRDSTTLEDYGRPYIVAELNTSHFGSVETAMVMIDKAKEVGCDCVKFQSWSDESLYSVNYYDENPIARRFVKKFSMAEAELKSLHEHCVSIGMGFASTPYSRAEVDFLLEQCDVPYIKVASMDLNNHPFLDYIARTGAPVVLSTGMGETEEIVEAVRVFEEAGNNNLCVLHCVSIYPVDTAAINLNNIVGLRSMLPDYPVGYSDHSMGSEMATAATALGACMLEKHFTLDRSKIGMDNQMAAEPDEMKHIVEHAHNVNLAMGSQNRSVSQDELDQRKQMRRSLVYSKDLAAGTRLSEEDFDAKRPGTGFSPNEVVNLVGRVLAEDVRAQTLVEENDLVN